MKKWILIFLIFLISPHLAWAGFSVSGVNDPKSVGGVDYPKSVGGVESVYCTLPYTTNLALWLSAKCSDITESGNEISQWNDLSGNNNHVTQSSAALKPTLTTEGGFASVEFDGADGMDLTSTIAFGDYSVIAVIRPDDAADEHTIISGGTNALQWRLNTSEAQNPTKCNFSDIATSSSSCSTSNISIIAFKFENGSGNDYKFWLNDSTDGSGTHNDELTANMENIGSKYGDGLSDSFNGHILELVVFTELTSDGNIESIIDYFNDIYGVY